MIAGARVEVATYKKHAADFVLWKPSAPELPGWDSPWGRGRPGWHLECSAMSKELLGKTFDIHGGGQDLIFPHHENELAQSTCAHDGAPFAQYWVHNGYLIVEGEKMSKSLGNIRTVRELLDQGHRGETIRFLTLSKHYRKELDWTEAGLREAKSELDRLYVALFGGDGARADGPPEEFMRALEDDLNTPLAIASLHELATEINKAPSRRKKYEIRAKLRAAGEVLGILQKDAQFWLQSGTAKIGANLIEQLIEQRNAARKANDYEKADSIRKELATHGVVLEDGPDGTFWRMAG